jgi:hypothetical protein
MQWLNCSFIFPLSTKICPISYVYSYNKFVYGIFSFDSAFITRAPTPLPALVIKRLFLARNQKIKRKTFFYFIYWTRSNFLKTTCIRDGRLFPVISNKIKLFPVIGDKIKSFPCHRLSGECVHNSHSRQR